MANWKFIRATSAQYDAESGAFLGGENAPARWEKTDKNTGITGDAPPSLLGPVDAGVGNRGQLYQTAAGQYFLDDSAQPGITTPKLRPDITPELATAWTGGTQQALSQRKPDMLGKGINFLGENSPYIGAAALGYGAFSGALGGAAGAGGAGGAGSTAAAGIGDLAAFESASASVPNLWAPGVAASGVGAAGAPIAGAPAAGAPAAAPAAGAPVPAGAPPPVPPPAAAAGWTIGEKIQGVGAIAAAGSLAMKLGGGSESRTSTTTLPPLSAEEKEFIALNKELAQKQLDAIDRQTAVQTETDKLILDQLKREQAQSQAYDAVNTPEKIQADAERQRRIDELSLSTAENDAALAAKLGPIQEEILNIQLEELRRGGKATPEQLAAIKEAADAGIASGTFDIDAATERGIGLIADELANSRGLRLTDSPMSGEAALLAREGQIQKGGLIRGIRAGEAQAALDYPLAVSRVQSAQAGGMQSAAQAATQFQAQLRDRAYQNRLAMTGQATSGGLGLSSISAGSGGLSSLTQRAISSGTSSGFGSRGIGLSDISGLAQGLGTGYLAYKGWSKTP